MSLADRLIASSRSSRNIYGCRIWTGAKLTNGYGRLTIDGRSQLAHRASYETFVGPIPDGLTIDHVCRVKACILPAHLEAVSYSENNTRRHRMRRPILLPVRGAERDRLLALVAHHGNASGRVIEAAGVPVAEDRWTAPLREAS